MIQSKGSLQCQNCMNHQEGEGGGGGGGGGGAYVIFVFLLTLAPFSADTKNTLIPDFFTPKNTRFYILGGARGQISSMGGWGAKSAFLLTFPLICMHTYLNTWSNL